jgi:hypothetical protein
MKEPHKISPNRGREIQNKQPVTKSGDRIRSFFWKLARFRIERTVKTEKKTKIGFGDTSD